MHVVLHVNGYYDWEPVPSDTEVTDEDVEAMRVKPSQNGGWLMKVEKDTDVETSTTVVIPEIELISMIIQEMCRGDRTALTRVQAAHRYLSRYHLDHNTHKKWIQEIEVSDDGGDEELLRSELDKQVKAGNISEHDVEELVEAYNEPSEDKDHVDHMHKTFGIKDAKIEKNQARREERAKAFAQIREHHAKTVADAAEKANAKKTKKGVRAS